MATQFENESTAAVSTLEKCREITGCPAGVDLQDWVKRLAAENVGLKSAITDHSQSVHFCEVCGKDDPCSTDDVCYALRETPATDRIYAGIKAEGVEMFALMFAEEAIKDNNITTGWKARASRAASEYAELLREGAK